MEGELSREGEVEVGKEKSNRVLVAGTDGEGQRSKGNQGPVWPNVSLEPEAGGDWDVPLLYR